MFERYIHQGIALEEEYPCVAGSAPVTNLLYLHLRLDVIGKSSKCPSSVAEAGGFDLHLATIAAIGGAFQVGKTIFFQDRRVGGVRCSRIFGSLHALRIDAPAAESLRQWPSRSLWLGRRNCRQRKNDQEKTQTL